MKIDELVFQLQQAESFILAIDGMSTSGKTTLATQLQEQLGGHVFHMDDFFLPAEKRTPQRLAEPGGNVDYERFLETVLKPLSQKQTVSYQPFDCSVMALDKTVHEISYHPYNIIEGSYALHPELLPYYTHQVVLRIDSKTQLQRLQKRNPKQMNQFIDMWIPLENDYFTYYQIFEKFPVID